MAEPIKFSEDEIKKLQDIQNTYFNIQGEFGRLSMTRLRLDQQLEALNEKEDELSRNFEDTQSTEEAFIDSINEKYGDGVYDPESGTFTPAEKK